ncbi:hypothetical protein D3C73_870650 [compost metagenome]
MHLVREIDQVGVGLFNYRNQDSIFPIGIDPGIFYTLLNVYPRNIHHLNNPVAFSAQYQIF